MPAVSKIGQSPNGVSVTVLFMHEPILILTIARDGDDGMIVTFSDGTAGAYVVEELLELRPYRELADSPFNTGPFPANISQ
jgi:hypothetical protein